MSEIAIKIENLSKQYKLGQVGTGTLSHDLNRWIAKIRGKEDPTLKIGQENSLSESGGEYVWALKDINIDIEKGEILGIIGKNGAGKSTLLKILSRVTGPTTGSLKINGRIASLLEVGTGFHPELTGKENIFINGAILGMTKKEIKSKLDEIVDFAGVAKYIDTPVKRYSSGMYVRLAFAVAAYLDSEILVVDEVLAVGDAEFQKKAVGKMKDVSKGSGRTVLFVSHNMGLISQFCNNAILLKNGKIDFFGKTENVIARYQESFLNDDKKYIAKNLNLSIFLKEAETVNEKMEPQESFLFNENIYLKTKLVINEYDSHSKIGITLQSANTEYLSTFIENLADHYNGNNEFSLIFKFPANLIVPNLYAFRIALFTANSFVYDLHEMICPFNIIDNGTKMALFQNYGHGFFIMDYKIINCT